jgi:HEPN domain-containing protein
MTSPETRRIEIVRAWIESARVDRDVIALIEVAGPAVAIGFHAQQAVEKLLKALLVSYGVEPEDTHVIGALVGQLHRLDRTTGAALGPVDRLTPYAVLHRYPPRSGRTVRSMDRASVLADLDAARRAWATLDRILAARLAALGGET